MRDGEASENFEGEYSPEMIDHLRREYDSLFLVLAHKTNELALLMINNKGQTSMEDANHLAEAMELLEECSRKDNMAMTGDKLEFSISELGRTIDGVEALGRSFGSSESSNHEKQ